MCSNLTSALRELSKCKYFVSHSFRARIFTSLSRIRVGDLRLVFVLCRLVGGSGDIKLTKDGNTLLKEMVGFEPLFFFVLYSSLEHAY